MEKCKCWVRYGISYWLIFDRPTNLFFLEKSTCFCLFVCLFLNSSRSTFTVKFLPRFLCGCLHKECWGLWASMSCDFECVWLYVVLWFMGYIVHIPIPTLICTWNLSFTISLVSMAFVPGYCYHPCLESNLWFPGSQIVCGKKVKTWIHSCHAMLLCLSHKFN